MSLDFQWSVVVVAAVFMRFLIQARGCRRTQLQLVLVDIAILYEVMVAFLIWSGSLINDSGSMMLVAWIRPILLTLLTVIAAFAQRIPLETSAEQKARVRKFWLQP